MIVSGIGPQQTLTVQDADGSPLVTGVIRMKFTNGSVTDDGGGVVSINTSAGDITGSGTANTVSKFTSASAIGNSLLTDDGTILTYSGVGGIKSPFFVSAAANPADAGAVRLGNTETIAWEAATPGTDLTLGVNASDVLVSSAAMSAPSLTLTTTPLAAGSGGTGISSLGTGVATALGVNVDSAGAFVVNGGALGTPTSGIATNLTGTASININGTVGATTPASGSFTTLTTSGDVTMSNNANATKTWTFQNTDNTNTNSRAQLVLTGGTVGVRHLIIAGDDYYFGTTTSSGVHLQVNSNNIIDLAAAGATITGTLNTTGLYKANGTNGVSAGSFSSITAITSTNGIVTQLTGTSDERLKTIDGRFDHGLKDLMKIKPIRYHWSEYFLKHWNQKNSLQMVGVTAQNIREVMPEAVGVEKWTDGSEWLSVNKDALTMLLINAVQEQQREIEALKSQG